MTQCGSRGVFRRTAILLLTSVGMLTVTALPRSVDAQQKTDSNAKKAKDKAQEGR